MEKKEVAIGEPVAVAGVTLFPVVEDSLNHWHGKRGSSYIAARQPVAVIVLSPSAKRAFRISGEEVSLDQLAREFPAIKNITEIYPPPG